MFSEPYPKKITTRIRIAGQNFFYLNMLIWLLIFFWDLHGAVNALESKVQEQRGGSVLLHPGPDDSLSSAGKQVSTVFSKSRLIYFIIIPEVISKGERFRGGCPHVARVKQSSCPEAVVRIKTPPS